MALTFTHKDLSFSVGDSIKVNYKIKEKGDKERIQAFDGVVLSIKGKGDKGTFVVMKNASDSVKVERIFPINSPWIESIKKMRGPKKKIRRAKLYFLRKPKARTV
ncbi:50S ribosomal protein L19 [Candidatus Shapirobacteria bacterium RIFOXYD1_FULL_38_32]|uniref:50S ribosomal protein L19 n=1 Tax=Candidatus Shapirobacteria bacterium GW2011_GWE1_38_92 TaxID=1618489 RepID=A0A0G0LH55_9BACT|nr:MAG: 50S ribosomal protein L19 [Candidatus Shapirobacteria bacterium GW2011_GWE1_38_92]OGL56509.1 MAG: 50S ribosomal protein L19 [Candidatus Shapirobacteria bacterium RIFOXYA1_FULL_39_17]OGL58578.1 MAG: 50S ribosomal protein L19 [Candidatus Shapirobacteria bacterium RIFOXYD1_FULL_38_32]HCU55157.1 50S ribosomal protein L19 [Candidatus Shapirobacteria bacterium]